MTELLTTVQFSFVSSITSTTVSGVSDCPSRPSSSFHFPAKCGHQKNTYTASSGTLHPAGHSGYSSKPTVISKNPLSSLFRRLYIILRPFVIFLISLWILLFDAMYAINASICFSRELNSLFHFFAWSSFGALNTEVIHLQEFIIFFCSIVVDIVYVASPKFCEACADRNRRWY